MEHHKLAVQFNFFRNEFEAVCPSCKRRVFVVSAELIYSSGMPIPTSYGHPCNPDLEDDLTDMN